MWKKLTALLKSTVGVSAVSHEKAPARNKAGQIIKTPVEMEGDTQILEKGTDPAKVTYTLRCECATVFRVRGEAVNRAVTGGLSSTCPVCAERIFYTVHDHD